MLASLERTGVGGIDRQTSMIRLKPATSTFLHHLLKKGLLLDDDWEALPPLDRERLEAIRDPEEVCRALVECQLLTEYQTARILNGNDFGLVLGNYRVLDRLGAGGMGVVFRGENVWTRRPVAIKVMAESVAQFPRARIRFLAEARVVANLQHPNIAAAFDAGLAGDPDRPGRELYYLVMEYVEGLDLDQRVRQSGSLPVVEACKIAYQTCGALAEAHRQGLVHRDIKPSNILVTSSGMAKLLDFGLARLDRPTKLTEPGVLLGTLGFMAPEQIEDANSVDHRADIYSLGCTLFWCLTGRDPFPPDDNILHTMMTCWTQSPPRLRDKNPELPVELDEVVAKMMAGQPKYRFQTCQEAMASLLPFLQDALRTEGLHTPSPESLPIQIPANPILADTPVRRVLIVDDEENMGLFCSKILERGGFICHTAPNGQVALDMIDREPYDVVLLDMNMPELGGLEVIQRIRSCPNHDRMKVVVMSGGYNRDQLIGTLPAGADDCLTKPFSGLELDAKVQAVVRLKVAQELADRFTGGLQDPLANDCPPLSDSGSVSEIRDGLVMALALLVERKNNRAGGRPVRLREYCRVLVDHLRQRTSDPRQYGERFRESLAGVLPLMDIGTLVLPDHILLKPGQLSLEERFTMQSHTVIGAEVLSSLHRQGVAIRGPLKLAAEVARSHHERFDGKGYPDGLEGDQIPLGARIAAVVSVYDGLRSRRMHRPGLTHSSSIDLMTSNFVDQFDPTIFAAFVNVEAEFEKIFAAHAE